MEAKSTSQADITHSHMYFPSLTLQLVDRGVQDKRPGGSGKWFALEISMFVYVCMGLAVVCMCVFSKVKGQPIRWDQQCGQWIWIRSN